VRWRIWSAALLAVSLGLLARADDPPKKADEKKPDEKKAEPKTPAEKVAAVRKEVSEALNKAQAAYAEQSKAKGDDEKKAKEEAFQKALEAYQAAQKGAGAKYAALAKEFPSDPAALDAIQGALQFGRGKLPDDLVKILKEHHLNSPKLGGLIENLMRDEGADSEALLKTIAAEATEKGAKGPALYALAYRRFDKLAGYDSQATKADYDKLKPDLDKQLDAVEKDYADVKFGRAGKLGEAVGKLRGSLEKAAARLIGQPSPDIAGEAIDGKAFKLSDYKGKVVMIDFWGDW